MRTRAILVMGALTCALTFASTWAMEDGDRERQALFERLRSLNPHEPSDAIVSLRISRRNTISTLLRVIDAPDRGPVDRRVRAQAMMMLGEYRAEEGTLTLARHLSDYIPMPIWDWHPLNSYPAAYALVRIGDRSIPALYPRLTGAVGEDELKIMAFVVYMIDGQELGLARLTLAKDGRGYGDSTRANIGRLRDLYKTIDFTDIRQWPSPKEAVPAAKKSP